MEYLDSLSIPEFFEIYDESVELSKKEAKELEKARRGR